MHVSLLLVLYEGIASRLPSHLVHYRLDLQGVGDKPQPVGACTHTHTLLIRPYCSNSLLNLLSDVSKF